MRIKSQKNERLEVRLPAISFDGVPGKTFAISIEIVNRAARPEHVLIAVQGLPDEWLDRSVIGLDMEAHERRRQRMTIAIPKIPQTEAGGRVFGLQVGCLHAPESVLRFSLYLEVALFAQSSAAVEKSLDRTNPMYSKVIANRGNTTDTYHIGVEAAGIDLRPRGEQSFQLAAGCSRTLTYRSQINRQKWLGGPASNPIRWHIVSGQGQQITLTASLQTSPRMQIGSVWLAAAALALVCSAFFLMLRANSPAQASSALSSPISEINYQPLSMGHDGRALFPGSEDPVQVIWSTPAHQPTLFVALSPTPILSPTPRPTLTSKVIYLTFDDGPHKSWTPGILDLLDQYNAKATFFVVGLNVQANPALADRIWESGHGLANHTWAHVDLAYYNLAGFSQQIQKTDALLGERVSACLRPPFGRINAQIENFTAQLGKELIMWDIDPADWSQPGSQVISQHVISRAYPGAIVLLHDGGGNRAQTLNALETILATLSGQGYQFEAICP